MRKDLRKGLIVQKTNYMYSKKIRLNDGRKAIYGMGSLTIYSLLLSKSCELTSFTIQWNQSARPTDCGGIYII